MSWMTNDPVSLEPRLQEYLKKKEFYEFHKMAPTVDLKKQYDITKQDEQRILAFQSGDTDLYNYQKQDQYLDQVFVQRNSFKRKELCDDPRFEKLQKKIERDRNAFEQRNNFDNGLTSHFQLLTKQHPGANTTSSKRSIGYRNPSEHYYDYVNPRTHNPNMPFPRGGISTRLDNYAPTDRARQFY